MFFWVPKFGQWRQGPVNTDLQYANPNFAAYDSGWWYYQTGPAANKYIDANNA